MKNLFTLLILQVGLATCLCAQNLAPQEKKKESAPAKADDALEYSAPAISNTNTNSVQKMNNYQSTRDNSSRSLAARDKVQSMKIGYITQSINLTSQEAQAFWPLYNEYELEMKTVRQNMRLDMMETKMNFNTMSDKEVDDMLNNLIAQKSKEADLFKTYHEKFKKILPIRKVAMLYKAENNFKKQLLDRLGN